MIFSPTARSGVAAIWVLVVVVSLSALTMTGVASYGFGKRTIDLQHNRVQADALSRAGIALAISRLLDDPEKYEGETVKPIADSEVRIVVKRDASKPGLFQVESRVRYPIDQRGLVVLSINRTLKRVDDKDGIRMEVAPGNAAVSP